MTEQGRDILFQFISVERKKRKSVFKDSTLEACFQMNGVIRTITSVGWLSRRIGKTVTWCTVQFTDR